MDKNPNAVGRRKEAIARIFIKKGKGGISVNGIDYKTYFPLTYLQHQVIQPLQVIEGVADQYDFTITAKGGGKKGQAEAIKLGIARILCKINEEARPLLKNATLLTRDPRAVERKKPGRKKARKKFQFVKR